ncbi:hypothetical protein B0H17DRAFT_1040990 [Mycena rosella]|uniref:Uncharacterized protein n=1 Tax=Mycena rosella TaxID=1033263 RepID=A0AAD7DYV4_MYCRO|nr:hypothetical protein B0H17DRAFT_1040990 [Mycena rosella]
MPMLRNLISYSRTNLFETTSGNFATELLNFHANQIGLDRIMYSVNRLGLTGTMKSGDLLALKRGLAVDVLRLNR